MLNILSRCFWGSRIDIQCVMSCRKDGITVIGHNDLQKSIELKVNITEIGTKILPVTRENFENRTANIDYEARIDIRSSRLWVRYQQAFFNIRLFDSKANRRLNTALSIYFVYDKKERKRQYKQEKFCIFFICLGFLSRTLTINSLQEKEIIFVSLYHIYLLTKIEILICSCTWEMHSVCIRPLLDKIYPSVEIGIGLKFKCILFFWWYVKCY